MRSILKQKKLKNTPKREKKNIKKKPPKKKKKTALQCILWKQYPPTAASELVRSSTCNVAKGCDELRRRRRPLPGRDAGHSLLEDGHEQAPKVGAQPSHACSEEHALLWTIYKRYIWTKRGHLFYFVCILLRKSFKRCQKKASKNNNQYRVSTKVILVCTC